MTKHRVIGDFQGEAYSKLLKFAIENSDCFGFSTFQYVHKKDLLQSYFDFLNSISPFEKDSFNYELPQHYCRGQKIHVYKINSLTYGELTRVYDLYDWRIPQYPEDLSFYKNGKVWLSSISHEKLCFLYTDSQTITSNLDKMGYIIEES